MGAAMTTISSSVTTNYSSSVQPVSQGSVAAEPLSAQPQESRDKIKPVAEQVYISKQAQQLYDTYTRSTNNANERYSTDSSADQSGGANAGQVADALKTVQNRQTARALFEYKQQQSIESEPKPEPQEPAKPSTSIQAIA